MNKLKKLIQNNDLLIDIINTLLGVALVVFLILIFKYPRDKRVIMTAFILGGSMNILNGVKYIKSPKKNAMGTTSIILGIIIIFIGYAITNIFQIYSLS